EMVPPRADLQTGRLLQHVDDLEYVESAVARRLSADVADDRRLDGHSRRTRTDTKRAGNRIEKRQPMRPDQRDFSPFLRDSWCLSSMPNPHLRVSASSADKAL